MSCVCLVLSCLVSCVCLVLSCLVSCFVLCCLVLSCLVFTCVVLCFFALWALPLPYPSPLNQKREALNQKARSPRLFICTSSLLSSSCLICLLVLLSLALPCLLSYLVFCLVLSYVLSCLVSCALCLVLFCLSSSCIGKVRQRQGTEIGVRVKGVG